MSETWADEQRRVTELSEIDRDDEVEQMLRENPLDPDDYVYGRRRPWLAD